MEDSLQKRYAVKLVANFVSGLINLIMIAIVPKALGPMAFGHFSYLQQFFSQVIALVDGGTSTAFFTKLSADNSRKELISFYLMLSVCIFALLSLFLWASEVLTVTSYLLPGIPAEYFYLGLWFSFFTWFTQVAIKITDAYALTVSVELIKVVHKIIMLGLLLYLVTIPNFDLKSFFYFHYVSLTSFLSFVSVILVKRKIINRALISSRLTYNKLVNEIVKFSSPIFVFNIVAILVSLFDIWLLQKVSGSVQTGFYGLAYSIAAICFLFTSAMTPLITREFAKSYNEGRLNTVRRLFKKYIPMLYAISAFFGVFIAQQSELILLLFTDEQFKGAYIALVIMAFYPLHQTYGQLTSALFFATEQTKLYKNIGIATSLGGLILSISFIYWLDLGAEGFAWKMLIIQIIGVNVQLYFNSRLLKLKLAPFIQHQIYSVVILSTLAFISIELISNTLKPELTIVLSGVFYTMMTLVSIYIMPALFMTSRKEVGQLYRLVKLKVSKGIHDK